MLIEPLHYGIAKLYISMHVYESGLSSDLLIQKFLYLCVNDIVIRC